jgi:tetratricopeptide (TPR) repeat protein
MKLYKLAPICAVLVLAVVSCGCKKLKARDQLNKGVVAFRNAQFQQAIKHFQTAVELDPELLNARLYLATAYFQLYVPGGDSKENVNIAKQAIAAYEDVLKADPNNVNAIASIAQIYYNLKDFDKAKEYQRRIIQLDPQNADSYYWIGVIDWAICYPRAMQLRKDLNIILPKDPKRPDILPPIPDKDRADLADKNGPLVDEGIQALDKAINIRPNDADAMTYLNLMYRQKAEIEADSADHDADLEKANDLMQKALGIRKGQTEKASAAVH